MYLIEYKKTHSLNKKLINDFEYENLKSASKNF